MNEAAGGVMLPLARELFALIFAEPCGSKHTTHATQKPVHRGTNHLSPPHDVSARDPMTHVSLLRLQNQDPALIVVSRHSDRTMEIEAVFGLVLRESRMQMLVLAIPRRD
jgi:hypothetical protein